MPPGGTTEHENYSRLLKGAKALRPGGCLVGVCPRWLTGQPPEAFGFSPPLLRGSFRGGHEQVISMPGSFDQYVPAVGESFVDLLHLARWCAAWSHGQM